MKTINDMTPEEVMAFVKQPGFEVVLVGLSGRLGKVLVFKQYKGRTLITKYPDRSKVVLTEKQMKHRVRFREAHLWAKKHLEEFREVAEKQDMSPYRYGIREFFKRGLREADQWMEVAENQHQTKGKRAEKRGIVNWLMVGQEGGSSDSRAIKKAVPRLTQPSVPMFSSPPIGGKFSVSGSKSPPIL